MATQQLYDSTARVLPARPTSAPAPAPVEETLTQHQLRLAWIRPPSARGLRMKRALDLLFGIPLFLLTLPVVLIAATAVKLVSPGPALFRQEREGYRGRRIKILKIRTMVPDAEERLYRDLERSDAAREEWGRYVKLREDPRVVPIIGNFLRRYSIDELPQLWNVIKGEMSLVGPRPFPYYHVEMFTDEFRRVRCAVPPGLTGLWQVGERSEGDLDVQERRDSRYVAEWSLWLDLRLILRTAWVVLQGKGAY